MPKEVSHILLAEKSVELMASSKNKKKALIGVTLESIAKKYPKAFAFGSVAPDIFFYDIKFPWERKNKPRGLSWGERIHGNLGEHTLKHIILQLETLRAKNIPYSLEQKEMLFAFSLGYLTHVALDSIIHPIVYYFAGNYYDQNPAEKQKSEMRHRVMETILDLYNLDFYHSDLKKFDALKKIRLNSSERKTIFQFYAWSLEATWPQFVLKRVTLRKLVYRGYKKLFGFNRLFQNRLFARCALKWNRIKNDKISFYSSLVYPAKNYETYLSSSEHRLFKIEDLSVYRNPLTNQEKHINPNYLRKKVLARVHRFFTVAYKLYKAETNPADAETKLKGYSLNHGQVGLRTDAMAYFSPLPVNGNFEWSHQS